MAVGFDQNFFQKVKFLKSRLAEIENPENWNFLFGTPEAIEDVFSSLQTNYTLQKDLRNIRLILIFSET